MTTAPRICFLALIFLWTQNLVGQTEQEQVARLKASANRPTITELQDTLKPWPKKNPFVWNSFKNRPGTLGLAEELPGDKNSIAAVIARMEYMFPGATWNFLGRDSDLTADIVEAFYRSIGQNDRVHRLRASGDSFEDIKSAEVLQFLMTNGFDLKNFRKKHPFIILDATSYSGSSQTRTLLEAGYSAAEAKGIKRDELLNYFNAININKENTRGEEASTEVEVGRFDRQKFFKESLGDDEDAKGPPEKIICISGTCLTYGLEWHDTYGPLKAQPNGVVVAAPGNLFDEDTREMILHEQFVAVQEVQKPLFLKRVQEEAKSLGFTFPMERIEVGRSVDVQKIEKEAPKKLVLKKVKESKTKFAERLKAFNDSYYHFRTNSSTYLSNAGDDVRRMIDRKIGYDINGPGESDMEKHAESLMGFTKAYLDDYLPGSDYIAVFIDSARFPDIEKEHTFQKVIETLKGSKKARELFHRARSIFLDNINPLSEDHLAIEKQYRNLIANKDACES